MLELRSPFTRILDGPGLLMQRLTEMVPNFGFKGVDVDDILLSMAESDPDYIAYLDSEGLLFRGRPHSEEEAWLS